MRKYTEMFIEGYINQYIHGLISIDYVISKTHNHIVNEIYIDVINDFITYEIEKRLILPNDINKLYYSNFLGDFIKNYDTYKKENAIRSLL